MEKPTPESFKLLTISAEKLPASMARRNEISEYATERARLLLGCYRTGDANDPATYVAAIAATLARYSEQIVTDVTHPVTGLPSKKSWLPTVKEVFDACEGLEDQIKQRFARERRVREQLAARAEEDRAKETKPTIEELKAKYGENFGLASASPRAGPQFKAPSWQGIASIYSADPSRIQRLINAADDQHAAACSCERSHFSTLGIE